MVSMDMSFDNPFNGKALSFDIGEDLICLFISEAARDGVKFHDSVNNGRGLCRRVWDDVAERVRPFVKEGFHFWFLVNMKIKHR